MHAPLRITAPLLLAASALVSCAGSTLAARDNSDTREAVMAQDHGYLAVIEIDISDQSWIADYERQVGSLVARHGGRILARTATSERIEGERESPDGVAIVEFPSRDSFQAFYDDPDYVPLREMRQSGSAAEFLLVPLEDLFAQSE